MQSPKASYKHTGRGELLPEYVYASCSRLRASNKLISFVDLGQFIRTMYLDQPPPKSANLVGSGAVVDLWNKVCLCLSARQHFVVTDMNMIG